MPDITMPQLGETVTEGTITRWAKKVGDQIEEDEVLFEVSTDKVDSEVPSPAAGYLAEILVQEGETADVGAKLAVISDSAPSGGDGGSESSEKAEGAEPSGDAEAAGGDGDAETSGRQATGGRAGEEAEGPAGGDSPDLAAETEEAQPEGASAESHPGGRNGDSPSSNGEGSGETRVLSPVVRRLLKEHDIQPQEVKATGAGGRITRADVLAIVDTRSAGGAPRSDAPATAEKAPAAKGEDAKAAAPAPAAEPAKAAGRDASVPFSNIRRRTAEHMRRSLDTSAHTLVVIEVDYEAVDKARLPAKARFKEEEGVGLTYLPFVARAVIDALHDFPNLNASVGENELILHRDVNLGIAVDLSHQGLIVPVVHAAQDKRLRALAREMGDLAARARGKKLAAEDISGGTFTITNPGGFGTLLTAPIINQPQVAIVSTDGVKPKPVALALPGGGYGVAVHPVGNIAISFDHRAVDGAYASAFLARLKELLETRDWAQELG